MRIAIYHNLPSGGAKRCLHEWVRRLVARHELALYTLAGADEGLFDLRPWVGKAVVYPYARPLHSRPLTPAGLLLRLADLRRLQAWSRRIAHEIDAGCHDVALVTHCRYTQAPLVLGYLRTPAVYFCHEPPRWLVEPPPPRADGEGERRSWPYRLGQWCFRGTFGRWLVAADRVSTRRARELLANSHYSREVLFHTYGRMARYSPLGVDATQFRPLGVEKEPLVLSVGALAPVKGHDFVLQAVARIPASRRPQVAIVADRGAAAEKVRLARWADRLGVTVAFHERIADEEMVALYNRAQVTACAAVMEPFGLVPLESMACSTPVVALGEGGFRETVLDGQTGLLTERDPVAFAQALDALLLDEARRERLGRQGRAYVCEQWTWERSTGRLEENLARAVGEA